MRLDFCDEVSCSANRRSFSLIDDSRLSQAARHEVNDDVGRLEHAAYDRDDDGCDGYS